MPQSKNIIVGAGLAGLSCASVLKDCLVLEKESVIGGLSRTLEFRDFRFDLGGHRFFTQDRYVDKFVRDLFRDELIEVNRKSRIYRNGKFIEYPLQVSVIFQLNPFGVATALFTYLYRKIKPLKELSFKERATNCFGDHLYKTFFKDYTEKVWGINCSTISPELVDIRLQNISLMRVIKHAFSKDTSIKSFSDEFIYCRKGIGRIADILSGDLDIRLNKAVTGLVYSNSSIKEVIVNNSEHLPCDNLVSTMPLSRLMEFFDSPKPVKEAIRNLKYRDIICVLLVLKKRSYTDDHWIYIHGSMVGGRLHEPKNWSPYMSPEEKTGICIEIFCNKNDTMWNREDAEIAHQVIKGMPFIDKFEIEDHFVVRVEYAYPIYDVNYKKNLSTVKDFLYPYKNLFLLGRTGSFKYINMDGCLGEGLKLGNFIKAKDKLNNAI